jgi:hypothetical protein
MIGTPLCLAAEGDQIVCTYPAEDYSIIAAHASA